MGTRLVSRQQPKIEFPFMPGRGKASVQSASETMRLLWSVPQVPGSHSSFPVRNSMLNLPIHKLAMSMDLQLLFFLLLCN